MLDPTALVAAVVDDRAGARRRRSIAAGFHEAIGRAAAALAVEPCARATASTPSSLTGGVFQNVRLTEIVETTLVDAGLDVLVHRPSRPTTAASASARPRSPRHG